MARIGKAHAFFNYDGSAAELQSLMEEGARAANFKGLSFHYLLEDEKRMLNPGLIEAARERKVHGSVFAGCSEVTKDKLSRIVPVPAIELGCIVEGREEGATNFTVAQKLRCVLGYVAGKTCRDGVFRSITFYRDAKKRFREY